MKFITWISSQVGINQVIDNMVPRYSFNLIATLLLNDFILLISEAGLLILPLDTPGNIPSNQSNTRHNMSAYRAGDWNDSITPTCPAYFTTPIHCPLSPYTIVEDFLNTTTITTNWSYSWYNRTWQIWQIRVSSIESFLSRDAGLGGGDTSLLSPVSSLPSGPASLLVTVVTVLSVSNAGLLGHDSCSYKQCQLKLSGYITYYNHLITLSLQIRYISVYKICHNIILIQQIFSN